MRILHMRDALMEVEAFVRGRARADLDRDRMLVLALVKEVEIIGEAANAISEESRALAPRVPWLDIIAMRHRLVHAYHDINLDILWRTCTDEIPVLHGAINALLKDLPPQSH